MITLAIDLGRHWIRYGVISNGKLQQQQKREAPNKGGALLLPEIEKICTDLNLELKSGELALAAPGPYRGNEYQGLGKNGWVFTIPELQKLTDRITVVHDVLAGAAGIPTQIKTNLINMGKSTETPSDEAAVPKAFIQTGVGLGASMLLPSTDGNWVPVSGEGGSAIIGANTDDEDQVYRAFKEEPGEWEIHSAQALLSNSSLPRIANILTPSFKAQTPETVVELASNGHSAAQRALTAYAGFLGTFAGNVALMYRAYGGVYIAGHLPVALNNEALKAFRSAFYERGLTRKQLDPIPVFAIKDEYHTLEGLRSLRVMQEALSDV